jgi:leader peptidase (prepilin peptidase) / N-methyltransferase
MKTETETAYKAIVVDLKRGGHRKLPVAVFFTLGIFKHQGSRYRNHMGTEIFFNLILFGILTLITWTDFRTQTIPDFFNVILAASGFAAVALLNLVSLSDAIIGLVFGVIAPLGLRAGFRALRGVDGLGLGDVKFLGAAGLWVGAMGLPWVVLIASISGLAFAFALQLVGKNFTRQTRLAFGPHLALGLFVTWIFKLNGML